MCLKAATASQQAGIITWKSTQGRSDVNFAPKDAATREETAHMLAKLLKLSQ